MLGQAFIVQKLHREIIARETVGLRGLQDNTNLKALADCFNFNDTKSILFLQNFIDKKTYIIHEKVLKNKII